MSRSTRAVAVLAVLATLALGACGGDDPEEPQTSPAVTLGTNTASPTTAAPADPATTDPTPTTAPTATETVLPEDDSWSTAENSSNFPGGGGDLLPVGVRTGDHDGFDRVVFDLSGSGQPGWRVTYVERAIEDPSGEEITLEGDAVSEVIISGLRMPEESEFDSVLRAGPIDVDDLDEVEVIHVSGLFEGQLQVLIGLESEVPFRVFVLQDPVRLVIDYQDD
ncbi:MAG: hypothetical protein GXY39_10770 [Actinomycetales bacterium]|nr:hypothetical protein [Actinomycetales bacterium]